MKNTDYSIKRKAEGLALNATSHREISSHIADFVRDRIPYHLDEWNVSAAEVLQKRRGMCAGKAILADELHRAVGIQDRFKVVKIMGEQGFFDFVLRRLKQSRGMSSESAQLQNN